MQPRGAQIRAAQAGDGAKDIAQWPCSVSAPSLLLAPLHPPPVCPWRSLALTELS